MLREELSVKNAAALVLLTVLGNTILGGAVVTGQDSWITLLLAGVAFLPVGLMYARLASLFPEVDIIDAVILLFGKVGGRIILVLFTWYALHLCAMVMGNFVEFISITAMPETPHIPIMIPIIAIALYLAKSGVVTFGKLAVVVCVLVLFVVLGTSIMALKDGDFGYLQPVLNHSPGEFMQDTLYFFASPFAETVVFLGISGIIRRNDSAYRIYLPGIYIAGFALLILILRNIILLGPGMLQSSYFPSYTATRIIHIGTYFERIESVISFNYIMFGMAKIVVCLIVVAKGVARLFNVQPQTSYKRMLAPAALLVLALCILLYENVMQLFMFAEIYKYYALIFQVLLPLIIWIVAEIKLRRRGLKRVTPELTDRLLAPPKGKAEKNAGQLRNDG